MDDLETRARRLLAGGGNKRVEIMVSGPLARIGEVRKSLDLVQRQLVEEARHGGGKLELRVTAFLDGCRHTTPWSASPVDAAGATTRWHCFEGETLFAEAFAHCLAEREKIDAIIIFGDRFDDQRRTLEFGARLRERGIKIFAFHVGPDRKMRRAYDALAEQNGGVSVPLSSDAALTRVLPLITNYLFRPAETLRALPAPKDVDIKALIDRLKLQPIPAPLRALPPSPVAGMLPPPMPRVPVKR
jgi:hypothetical protein